jgi:cytosine/adenosine deaminase-related metal-dependent hydrolase
LFRIDRPALIRYHASWIVPIGAPPIRDGWVGIENGRIVVCGANADRGGTIASDALDIDLGEAAILPGLVNAHTHLELSYLRGRVLAGPTFVSWIRALMATRRDYPDPDAPEILAGIADGIAEAIRCGTAVVGDICNTWATCAPLGASALDGVVFYEILGFNPDDPIALVDRALAAIHAASSAHGVRTSLAAHAPYSVAPAVLRAISAAVETDGLPACSVHLSESAEEVEFVRTGGGPWRVLLGDFGVWNPAWLVPGVSPVQYLDDQGFLGSRVLAIHGTQMTADDLQRLAARRATLVACPRSNVHTGAGSPPIEQFYASGVQVAVGTDSLASTADLNVFSELAMLRTLARAVPAALLLDSATRQGARALGLDTDFGTIAAGKRARLISVTVPSGVDDVEEYLVSGIEPEQITWLTADG